MGTVGDFNETVKLIIELIENIGSRKFFTELARIQSLVLSLQSQHSAALSANTELQEMIAAKSREINELKNEIMRLEKKDDTGGFSSGVVISEH